jgi:ParB family chromosome partitioning protein
MQRRLSVRQTEELVRRMLEPPGKAAAKKPEKGKSRDIQRLEETLSEKFAAPVHLESRDGKSGRLVIVYSSLDELDGIIERLG